MRQQIRFARASDGPRIAYATSGAGPPLVRVTNWLTHLDFDWESPIWSHWFRELSRGHTLVRYDARGTGLSDRAVRDLSIESWVRDLQAVVDDLGLERFHLLGICQGGATAVAYAARHPQRVSRLVLYGSYPRGAFAGGVARNDAPQATALAKMIEVGWGRQETAFRKVFADLLIPQATREQQCWMADLQQRTVSPQTAAALWRAFHTLDVTDLAGQIQTPSLVLHARQDAMVAFDQGRRLASLIPAARFVPLESQNHILRQDEPAWPCFLDEVRRFLHTAVPHHLSEEARDEARSALSDLTPREREVLNLLAQGLSNDEIAAQLVIAAKTVRNHVTRIYRKLQVDSRAQAIVLARETGNGHLHNTTP